MHRPAETLAQAVHATVNLRHHGLRIATENQWISVAAIGGQRRITRAEVAQRAHDRRLGAIGEVGMAADHTGMLSEGTLHALFELADTQHLSVDPDLPFGVECLHAHLIPLTCVATVRVDCSTGRSDPGFLKSLLSPHRWLSEIIALRCSPADGAK